MTKGARAVTGGLVLAIVLVGTAHALSHGVPPPASTVGDPVLDWNAIALQATADDHTGTFGPAEQSGPTRTARALAIVHAAIYDATAGIAMGNAVAEYVFENALQPVP